MTPEIIHRDLPDPNKTTGTTLVMYIETDQEPGWNVSERLFFDRDIYAIKACDKINVFTQWKPLEHIRYFHRPMVDGKFCKCDECKKVHGKSKRRSKPDQILWRRK